MFSKQPVLCKFHYNLYVGVGICEKFEDSLGFEAFQRAGDSGSKLSVLSCKHLLKENEIGCVECVYREMIRRRIEQGKGCCQRLGEFHQMWLLLIL